jgi:hypothetical protein
MIIYVLQSCLQVELLQVIFKFTRPAAGVTESPAAGPARDPVTGQPERGWSRFSQPWLASFPSPVLIVFLIIFKFLNYFSSSSCNHHDIMPVIVGPT